MIISFMASAKQIAWRKKFAKLYGKKKKGAKSSQKQVINSIKSQIKSGRPSSNMQDYLRKKYPKNIKSFCTIIQCHQKLVK